MDDLSIGRLVDAASVDVVVLDRVAYGAGMTNWFVCRTAEEYAAVRRTLRPRNCVSVYLDGRIALQRYEPSVREEILRIAARERDCVVVVAGSESGPLETWFIAGDEELDELEETLSAGAEVYIGAFPGRDDDGVHAVTFIVPGPDGVVRGAPY